MTKFFKKSNKPHLGAILGPFCQNLGKNKFSWKKRLCQFLDIPIIYHCNNNQKKTIEPFVRKNAELTDGQMNIWTEGETETTVLDS